MAHQVYLSRRVRVVFRARVVRRERLVSRVRVVRLTHHVVLDVLAPDVVQVGLQARVEPDVVRLVGEERPALQAREVAAEHPAT